MDPVSWGLAFVSGAALASAFWTWKMKPTPSQLELMHQNVALSILASGAIGRLSDDEQDELEAEVSDMMEEAFGDGAGVVVGEEVDDLE